jgi:uncharacterized ion transporter superfamily protein YfcC
VKIIDKIFGSLSSFTYLYIYQLIKTIKTNKNKSYGKEQKACEQHNEEHKEKCVQNEKGICRVY